MLKAIFGAYRHSGCFWHKNKTFYMKDVCIKAGMKGTIAIIVACHHSSLQHTALISLVFPYNEFCGLKCYNCSSVMTYEVFYVANGHVSMGIECTNSLIIDSVATT